MIFLLRMKKKRESVTFSEQEQHEEGTYHKENADGKHGIAHAPGDGFDDAEAESTGDGGQFFHHIVEAEKGSMIGGVFRQHLRIGRPCQRL